MGMKKVGRLSAVEDLSVKHVRSKLDWPLGFKANPLLDGWGEQKYKLPEGPDDGNPMQRPSGPTFASRWDSIAFLSLPSV
jgi:hypothetical protein